MGWAYLVVALLVLGLTFFQGWLGGELVFSDGVGVVPTGQGTQSPSKAAHRVRAAVNNKSGEHHEQ